MNNSKDLRHVLGSPAGAKRHSRGGDARALLSRDRPGKAAKRGRAAGNSPGPAPGRNGAAGANAPSIGTAGKVQELQHGGATMSKRKRRRLNKQKKQHQQQLSQQPQLLAAAPKAEFEEGELR